MVGAHRRADIGFRIFNYCLGTFFLLLVAYPLMFIISASFSDPFAVASGQVRLFPVRPTILGYKAVFKHEQVLTGYANSLFYAAVGTFCSVTATLFGAYPLSRRDFPGRRFFTFVFAFTMIFTGGMIPTFFVVRSLHLIDTRAAMILPSLVGVWNLIVARSFFEATIPKDLQDAARIDGSSDIRFFFQIVLPISAPLVSVLVLFYAVGYWNSFYNALLYLNDAKLFPLQIVLRNILINSQAQQNDMIMNVQEMLEREAVKNLLKYALIVVTTLPVLMIYPFVQKYFVKGVMIGSIKG